jgi:hypothetical protein
VGHGLGWSTRRSAPVFHRYPILAASDAHMTPFQVLLIIGPSEHSTNIINSNQIKFIDPIIKKISPMLIDISIIIFSIFSN